MIQQDIFSHGFKILTDNGIDEGGMPYGKD